ncbi:alpha/beta hydrolase [Chitinophaga sp. Mgbs1]|uniref:Alpha/beta hydrolase n=1 Tax=Chitinophaga solisilvae TaxID=1233460 RepID=A0A3S1CWX2_9BACT|nr:alpha/beta hydrolase [Chitinophaga solisilvae]
MRTLLIAALMLASLYTQAQTLYTKAFGSPKDKAVIFLHGGPGYNAVNFEVTAAQQLADKGFYVIVYDRRGEGRSVDSAARFTFAQTFDDLAGIYKTYGLKKAILMGHSFGGVVAALYAAQHPAATAAVVMVSAPVSMQESFRTILQHVKEIYTARKDSTNLNYISMIENMDTSSIQYSSYTLGHAMLNGFYAPKHPSAAAKAIYKEAAADKTLQKYGNLMQPLAARGFWEHEKYTTLSLTATLEKLIANKTRLYGIYGKEDGLYSPQQVASLEKMTGTTRMFYLENAAHNVFADQREEFVRIIEKIK